MIFVSNMDFISRSDSKDENTPILPVFTSPAPFCCYSRSNYDCVVFELILFACKFWFSSIFLKLLLFRIFYLSFRMILAGFWMILAINLLHVPARSDYIDIKVSKRTHSLHLQIIDKSCMQRDCYMRKWIKNLPNNCWRNWDRLKRSNTKSSK